MWLLVRMVFWLSLVIALLPVTSSQQETSASQSRGNRCLVCCERGGLRHPSILRASAGRLRRRLTSDRSVRTQGRDRRKVALSVSEREKGRGSITSHREGHG